MTTYSVNNDVNNYNDDDDNDDDEDIFNIVHILFACCTEVP